MVKRLLLASAAAAIAVSAATAAMAADLPSRRAPPVYAPAPPIPVFTWTGFYIGGQVGYAFGRDNHYVPSEGAIFSSSPSGVIGGAHVGYNVSTQSIPVLGQIAGGFSSIPLLGGFGGAGGVVGIEGDVDGSGVSGAQRNPITTTIVQTRVPLQGSIRGRIGIAVNRVLFFATGGAAFGDIRRTYFAPTGAIFNYAPTRVGYTVGGGIEYGLTNNLSVRAEYRYTDFGRQADLVAGFVPVYGRVTEQIARAGFSYKFDTAVAAPVVARY